MKSREKLKNVTPETNHKNEIIKLIKEAAYSKDISKVFNDFLEMAAIAISNTVDFTHREEREKRYLEIINSYEKRHQELFPEMLAQLVLALDEKAQTVGTEDVLGVIFHELELHDVYKGQFFTPHHVSDMMAQITCGEDTQIAVEEQGYITACEPCCGSGVMILSFCKAMKKNNLNYQNQLVITAVDLDVKCVHMTFLQLALYGIPAVVIHGNSLTCEEFSRWYTPIYLLNGWVWRQRCRITNKFCVEDEMIKRASEPIYATFKRIETLIPDTEPAENIKPIEVTAPADLLSIYGEEIILNAPKSSKKTVTPQEVSEQISLFDLLE